MTAIPLDGIIIDIGNVPQWFIAIAAAGVLYKVWVSEKHTAEALTKIEQVCHETISMRAALELASKAEGRLVGRHEMREEMAATITAEKETVRHDAVADAETQAQVRAADPDGLKSFPASVGIIIAEATKITSDTTDERK